MLYFRIEEIQKLATYAPKSFQLLGGFDPHSPNRGFCPWTSLGPWPPDPQHIPPNACCFPPNLQCLDKTLHAKAVAVVIFFAVVVKRLNMFIIREANAAVPVILL